ncbi:MAG: hypothetical protein JSV26_10940 [bacterium]|nr:MAG: hypothetical protein JSV26_10940 [bacterium]
MNRNGVSGAVFLTVILLAAGLPTEASGGSARLRYGFSPGKSYRVREMHHDVGKTVTVMNVMGQEQEFETPMDQVSEGVWSATVTGGGGSGVKLAVTYGKHKGGQRWSSDKIQSDDFFADSRAEVVIHPVKGAIGYSIKPDEPTIDLIYRARFIWMPVFPEGSLSKGSEFSHEYVLKSGMYNIKSTDDYYLVEVKGGYAHFDVESRQVAVIRLTQPQGTGQIPAGMGMNMSDMKIAYRGEGTAVFDIGEGIFVEREGKMSYSNMEGTKGSSPMPGGAAFSSRMEGTVKYRWEMERD